jgi:hypothetical protein
MTDASRRAVLLGARIRLVCSLLAPCAAGASVISVRHRIYEQDHQAGGAPVSPVPDRRPVLVPPSALFRCDGLEAGDLLRHLFALALRAAEVFLFVFGNLQNQSERLFALFADKLVSRHLHTSFFPF